jgi:hypothetical protein
MKRKQKRGSKKKRVEIMEKFALFGAALGVGWVRLQIFGGDKIL